MLFDVFFDPKPRKTLTLWKSDNAYLRLLTLTYAYVKLTPLTRKLTVRLRYVYLRGLLKRSPSPPLQQFTKAAY